MFSHLKKANLNRQLGRRATHSGLSLGLRTFRGALPPGPRDWLRARRHCEDARGPHWLSVRSPPPRRSAAGALQTAPPPRLLGLAPGSSGLPEISRNETQLSANLFPNIRVRSARSRSQKSTLGAYLAEPGHTVRSGVLRNPQTPISASRYLDALNLGRVLCLGSSRCCTL